MSSRVRTQVMRVRLPMYRFREDPFPPLQRTGTARVYPYPMQDDVTDELTEHEFTAVVLDNGLLRVTVLPDFGGHILSVRDLRNDREVFYHNLPLKFGLIALRGAWYSGGLEFNFPQVGHTVTTNDPLAWHLTENEDGSATVFLGTIERLTRMAWTARVTLRPNDGRLHTRLWLFNRTPFWHRIYFWTNVGVPARDDFRFLLPCTQVFSWWWGARGVANFPIHDGADLSRYTTHKRPTDLFAKDLRADWFGCYYEQLDYGVLHFASRFEVQGRKLWTWGTADDGAVWTKLLSDARAPYCEIQSGRFVHQGVHRLMPPRTVETWSEAWFPVWGLGGVLHASEQLALNAHRNGSNLTLRLFALVPLPDVTFTLLQGGKTLERTTLSLQVGEPQTLTEKLSSDEPVTVLVGEKGRMVLQVRLLLDGEKVRADYREEPAPHIGLPEQHLSEPTTVTDWLLQALEREERNEPEAAAECYRKALQLDLHCVAAMNGLAKWHLKRGELRQGKEWAQKALSVDPQSEDALWWMAVASYWEAGHGTGDTGQGARETGVAKACLRALGRSVTYRAAAFALLGELLLREGDHRSALDAFQRALEWNSQDSKALALAAFAARKLGDTDLAQEFLERCERVNPLEPLLWSERHFLRGTGGEREERTFKPFPDDQLWLDVVSDYEQVGAWGTVSVWFAVARRHPSSMHRSVWSPSFGTNPMLLYHAAFAMWQLGKVAEALALLRKAQQHSPLFVFPSRHEDAAALRTALTLAPDDLLAHYLLGTWLASVGRWDEAEGHWRKATQSEEATLRALAWRNLGLHFRLKGNWHEAATAYDAAIHTVSQREPLREYAWRLWLERDQVLASAGWHEKRVALFEGAPEAIRRKSQIVARWAEALLRVDNPEGAYALLMETSFKPWEGEWAMRQLWKEAHMRLGQRAMAAGNFAVARRHFELAADYPANLNVGKPHWTDDADALFWAGWCALRMGEKDAARQLLERAATENQPPNATTAEFKAKAATLLATIVASTQETESKGQRA